MRAGPILNKTLKTATAALLVLGSLTACSTGSDAEARFLAAVREDLETGFSDSELIGVARDACEAVANGGGQQAIQQLILTSGLSSYDYGLVVGNGATHLCPDQVAAFEAIYNG
jgi:hypothetical protein